MKRREGKDELFSITLLKPYFKIGNNNFFYLPYFIPHEEFIFDILNKSFKYLKQL